MKKVNCLIWISMLNQKKYFALDIIISIILLCFAAIAIILSINSKKYGVRIPEILLFSSLLYLLFRRRIYQSEDLLCRIPEANQIKLVTHIVFTVSFSLIIWLSWSNLYFRPPLYFALLLVATASIIINIICLDDTRNSNIGIALFKIIILVFVIQAGIYYQFPGIYGVDPWWHNEKILEIINKGHLPISGFGEYYIFPLFHLVSAITEIITKVPIYSSIFESVGFVMATSGVFVFLICKKLINIKAGLLAALIVSLTANNIDRSTAIIPMSLGYFFFSAILSLIFNDNKNHFAKSLLIILFSMAVIFTHPIASLITFLSLIAIFISIKLYKKIKGHFISSEYISFLLLSLFGVTLLTRWMQNPPGESSFFNWNLMELIKSSQIDAQFVLNSPEIELNIPAVIIFLNLIDYFILLGFGIIGALIYLHPKNSSQDRIALLLMAGMLFAIPYGFNLFNLKSILPDRWIIFLYFPLSILAIQGILNISNFFRNDLNRSTFIIIVVLSIIFTMIINPISNGESPFLFNGAVRIGYTQSELTSAETLSDMKSGNPVTDIYYGYILPDLIGYNKYEDMVQNNNSIFIQRNYYLQHPEWDEKYQIRIHEGGIGNYKPGAVTILDYIKEHGIDKGPLIYNNGNVKAYAIQVYEK